MSDFNTAEVQTPLVPNQTSLLDWRYDYDLYDFTPSSDEDDGQLSRKKSRPNDGTNVDLLNAGLEGSSSNGDNSSGHPSAENTLQTVVGVPEVPQTTGHSSNGLKPVTPPNEVEPKPGPSQGPSRSSNIKKPETATGPTSADKMLIRTLECPVCLDPCTPPIYQCSIGHHICFSCREKSLHCVTCNAPLTDSRNWIAEKISERVVKVDCRNAAEGCPEKHYMSKMAEHLRRDCEFSVRCLGDKNGECAWKGDGKELKKHVLSSHRYSVLKGALTKWLVDSPPSTYLLSDVIVGEVFWCVPNYCPDNKEVYPHCRWVGPCGIGHQYDCEFIFIIRKENAAELKIAWMSRVLEVSEPLSKQCVPPLNDFLKSLAAKGYEIFFMVNYFIKAM